MPDLALFYDHAEWLIPLQRVLDARGVDYVGIDVAGHCFDPAHIAPPAPIIFNRISMSSFKRTADHPIFYADALLGAWERAGARIINGGEAFAIDHNKARQLEIIASLGLKAPDTRVVRRREDIAAAAQTIGFPLLVKGNIGGAGRASFASTALRNSRQLPCPTASTRSGSSKATIRRKMATSFASNSLARRLSMPSQWTAADNSTFVLPMPVSARLGSRS